MDSTSRSNEEYLEEEWFIVRHSGEIPEIVFHSALFFLCEASDGPRLVLQPKQKQLLQQAALDRFREIILRDLQQANRKLPIYRGLARTIVNFQRYQKFCQRQQLDGSAFSKEIAAALLLFLVEECVTVRKGLRSPALNCSFPELSAFAAAVGLTGEPLMAILREICPGCADTTADGATHL